MATADRWNPETARKAVRATAGWNSISTVRTPCPTPSSTDCLALNRKAPGFDKNFIGSGGFLCLILTRGRIEERIPAPQNAPGARQGGSASPDQPRGHGRAAPRRPAGHTGKQRTLFQLRLCRRGAVKPRTGTRHPESQTGSRATRSNGRRGIGERSGANSEREIGNVPASVETPHDRKRPHPGMESFKSGSSSQEAGAAGCSAPEMRKTGPALLCG